MNSALLRSAFSKLIGTSGFKRISYGLSGVAITVATIAVYETITNTEIFPYWAGPSLAGGVVASSFVYSFLHTRNQILICCDDYASF